jgi:hypothetical protein
MKLSDVYIILGTVLINYGIYRINITAGIIFLGLYLIFAGYLIHNDSKTK